MTTYIEILESNEDMSIHSGDWVRWSGDMSCPVPSTADYSDKGLVVNLKHTYSLNEYGDIVDVRCAIVNWYDKDLKTMKKDSNMVKVEYLRPIENPLVREGVI